MEHDQVKTNMVRLHVVRDGPISGPFVILLHGFPEFWYGWHRQIPYLAEAGYHVWAPDQRGYNLSDKPEGIAAYTLDELGTDVIGLMDVAGEEKAFILGHDWGAAVAWWVAAKHPERVRRLVTVNVPHPLVMQKHVRRNLGQLLKSWYIFFFQVPWLPETLARLNDWNIMVLMLRKTSRPGTFTKRDLEIYRQAWSQPDAYKSMLNWYRAVVQKPLTLPANPRIGVPTLLIWGARDRFLGEEMAQPSIDLCDNGNLVLIEEATHWVQHEEAYRVNRLIDHFLRDDFKSNHP